MHPTVHPRMRGEHPINCISCGSGIGSSPHARGTRLFDRHAHVILRFIPACAGNTFSSGLSAGLSPVHPRMRGEHPSPPTLRRPRSGSSPHARGTPHEPCQKHKQPRFIPACAGNTVYAARIRSFLPVHPRMRGEHATTGGRIKETCGSSPHARGTPQFNAVHARHQRFIPACAGNTYQSTGRSAFRSVHPRMRGEHVRKPCGALMMLGSSPHARGTRYVRWPRKWRARFIPACAGNTVCPTMSCVIVTVHPRMRGEHALSTAKRIDQSGSSPHARGTLLSTGRA